MKLVIIDANVLIDFADTNQDVLGLLATVFEIYVPKQILDEVDGFNENAAADTGLLICHPTLEELTEAALRLPGLSAQDTLCFILARNHHWVCLTNDRRLRAKCAEEQIETIWGLEAMLIACGQKRLSKAKARETAEAIHLANPAHIGADVFSAFCDKLDRI